MTEAITEVRQFFSEIGRGETEPTGEVQYLENWINEINTSRPLSKREKLESALNDAVRDENYEKAAEVRDKLRKLPEE